VWVLSNYVVTLPIGLLYFKADCEKERVLIEWKSATEINNQFYTVEKSYNGIDWMLLKIVQGANNSSTATYYQIYDNNPNNGINLYRLMQTDYNGQIKIYNPIVTYCNINNEEAQDFIVFPNPFNDFINILFSNTDNAKIKYCIYDVTGRKIIEATDNSNMIVINTKNLTCGFYILKLESQDLKKCFNIVKIYK
jgi:hypothetical protein